MIGPVAINQIDPHDPRLADYVLTAKPGRTVAACELDPYWSSLKSSAAYDAYWGKMVNWVDDPSIDRYDLVKRYSWGIPTTDDISWIVRHLDGRAVVEIGAGSGYWAWQLSRRCVDVVAYDKAPVGANPYTNGTQYHPIHSGGPQSAAAHPTRALLLCWPPYDDPMAAEALAAYTGDLLVYCGERAGGCTADDAFFDALENDWELLDISPHHVVFFGVHDRVEVWRRITTPKESTS